MGSYAMERARARIAELASRGLDVTSFFLEASEVIARAIPAAGRPAWSTIDPASLLATSYVDPTNEGGELEFVQWAYLDEEWTPLLDLARSPEGLLVYGQDAAPGTSSRDAYAEQLRACGASHIILLALRSRTGETWGSLDLWREDGQAAFETDELAFLRQVSVHLAEGARRGLLIGEALDPDTVDPPGLLLLDDNWEIESASQGIEDWLADLPGRWRADSSLPTAVAAVAARAVQVARNRSTEAAMVRVRTCSGRWAVLHATALLAGGAPRRVAVIVESAHPARISSLLMAAYGLTEREQEVARLVLGGNSTNDIAAELFVSPHTIQQHLKSVFEKMGVRSRRQLVSRIFLAHYEPRVADNGDRVRSGRMVRGGPMNGASWSAPQVVAGTVAGSGITPS